MLNVDRNFREKIINKKIPWKKRCPQTLFGKDVLIIFNMFRFTSMSYPEVENKWRAIANRKNIHRMPGTTHDISAVRASNALS